MASSAHADSPHGFAVGGGDAGEVSVLVTKHFAFSAHLGPRGASGYAVETQQSPFYGTFRLQGPVSCLSVAGNTATIGIVKGDRTATAHIGEQFYLCVQDNDPSSPTGPDSFDNSGYTGQAPSKVCPGAQATGEPVTRGSIEVEPGS